MPTDARLDKYIAGAPEFAQPILEHLRELIHKICPEIEEDIKWSRPAFSYRGKMLLSMAAFKAHCSANFWIGPVNRMIAKDAAEQAGSAGSLERITELSDLPSKQRLLGYIREARRLIDEAAANPAPRKRKAPPKPEAEAPRDFAAALAKNKTAAKNFDAFSPTCRREYVEWVTEAKRDETRQKRIATALEWIAEGKPRNWKYM